MLLLHKMPIFPTAMRIMSLLHQLILINQSLVIIYILNHLPSQMNVKGSSAFLQVFYPHSTLLFCSPNLLLNLSCFAPEAHACYAILASVQKESKAFSLPQPYALAFFLYLLTVEHNCCYRQIGEHLPDRPWSLEQLKIWGVLSKHDQHVLLYSVTTPQLNQFFLLAGPLLAFFLCQCLCCACYWYGEEPLGHVGVSYFEKDRS